MPAFTWAVKYYSTPDGGLTYTMTDVQSVFINWGLQNITDVWAPARCIIEGRNVAQFTTNPLKMDNLVKVEMSSTSGSPSVSGAQKFVGQVSDIAFNYDFVTNGDTWRIEAEGTSARVGRQTADGTWTAGQNIEQAVEAFSPPITVSGYDLASTVSAQTFDEAQVGSLLGTLLQMEQGALGESVAQIQLYGRRYTSWFGWNWGDGTVYMAPDVIKFDQIGFGTRAQNYSTKVVVQPAGLAPQTGGTGSRVYDISTYDQTTTQAADLANYLNASLVLQEGDPITISAVDYVQSHNYLTQMASPGNPWSKFTIGFRGNLYPVYAIGGSITATPGSTRFTYNLIPAEVRQFLILDDAYYGKLNENKLGF